MESFKADIQTRRERARSLNRVIDRALRSPTEEALSELMAVAAGERTGLLCNRLFRRANRLLRDDPGRGADIVSTRDRRVAEIYGCRVPAGWFSAWCDGSSSNGTDGVWSGIGFVVLDPQQRLIVELGEARGALSPLDAELEALEVAVKSAVTQGADRLRVHTDCPALVHLWHGHREDVRLNGLRQVASTLVRLQLCLIPRRFNQWAHRLARRVMHPEADGP